MGRRLRLLRRNKILVSAGIAVSLLVIVSLAIVVSNWSWIKLTVYADSMEVNIYLDDDIELHQIVYGSFHHTFRVLPGEHSVFLLEHGERGPLYVKFVRTSILETEFVTVDFSSGGPIIS